MQISILGCQKDLWDLWTELHGNHRAGILAGRNLKGKSIELYVNGHLGSYYAMALWFYTFDLDNWGSLLTDDDSFL